MNPPENESLRKLLGQWKVTESLPPRFQQGVWRRIEQPARTTTAWELWRSWLESVFARRTVALAYVTVLLLTGLTAGYINGQAHEQRWKGQSAVQYVQSLDPDQKNHR